MKMMIALFMLMISIHVQAQTAKCPGTGCPESAGTMGEILGGGVSGAETVDVGCAQKILNLDRVVEGQELALPDIKDDSEAKSN